MARRSILSEDEDTPINLSPMIDCIFILLIFFIVTTVFVEEQGVQVAKPDAAAVSNSEDKESLVLVITGENKILIDEKEVPLAEVTARVKQTVVDAETPVVIRADEKSDHGLFVSVWDAARLGGADTLSFNTIN